ncbi:MAG: signal peptidase I [Chloroflexi bacterium]|nr:signal peptidase I [Chloroflexota bacterium]
MIDAIQSLWRELLGSWWVLIVIPALAFLRWALTSRWILVAAVRRAIFSIPLWNPILSPPAPAPNGGAVLAPDEFRSRWFLELIESGLVALLLVFFVIRPFVVQAFYIPSPSMVETLEVDDRILVNKFVYHVHPPHHGDIVVFEPPPLATDRVEDDWIKRVIGVPGDRIAVRNNHLYRNGVKQDEPYVALLDPSSDKGSEPHQSTGQYSYTFPDPDRMDVPPGQNAYIYLASGSGVQDMSYRVEPTADRTPKSNSDYLFFVRNDPTEGLEVVVPPAKVFVMGDNRNDSEDSHYWGYLDQKRVLGQAFCIFWPFRRAQILHSPSSH